MISNFEACICYHASKYVYDNNVICDGRGAHGKPPYTSTPK